MHRFFIAIIATMSFLLHGCEYFPEATFDLAPESRLPKWFTLPSGLSRSDVTVHMAYYVEQQGRSIAIFSLSDSKKKQKFSEVEGVLEGHEPLMRKIPQPGFSEGYPMYEIITVNGITEIIEHRKLEPIFYITDDPAVWAELATNKKLK